MDVPSSSENHPTLENRMEEFLKSITNPEILSTFEPIELNIYYKNEKIDLPPIYGFFTIYDLKLAIYDYFKEDYAAPNNQLLYIDLNIAKISNLILDFEWKANVGKPIPVFTMESPLNGDFISADGEKKIVELNPYENILLDTKINSKYKITLIFFKDAINYYTGVKPISEKEYNGRFYPYYPLLKQNKIYPDEYDRNYINNRLQLYKRKLRFIERTNEIIENNYDTFIGVKFAGIRYLSLKWSINTLKDDIDSIFYKIPVNERRPYIRLLPISTSPISKVHLKDISNNIPNIYQPQLLKQWSEEKNPTSRSDSLFFKIGINTTILNAPYVYATVLLTNKTYFEVIIDPPKDIRKIDLEYDAPNLGNEILEGVSILNTKNEVPIITKGKFIYGLESKSISRKMMEKRIQILQPFFQEIYPILNEQPFIMLRYKLVDNYVNEDNISIFLTILSNKKIIKGETTIPSMIQMVSEEFQIDLQTAQEKVTSWLRKKEEFQQIVVGETKEYAPVNNSGIDISIFQTKDKYSIHIYNIDNIRNLQRIITLLSLLFSLDDTVLNVSNSEIKALAQIERVVELESEEKEKKEESIEKEEENIEFYDPLAEMEETEMEETSSQAEIEEIKENSRKESGPTVAAEDLRNINFSKKEEKPVEKIVESDSEEKGIANFFIRKLQEADRSLFLYSAKNPSDKSYVQMCAANEMRQPAVINQEQYNAMIEEYKEESDTVKFYLYPPEKGEKPLDVNESDDGKEIITVLRYSGSDPLKRKENFYLCSEYFCTKDEIVVLKKDFENKGSFRPPKMDSRKIEILKDFNRCPFCNGKLVQNRKKPDKGETVLQRIPKPKTDKRHIWINFLKKTSHPLGYRLPCCFVKPHPITFEATESKYLKKKKSKEEGEEIDGEKEIDEEDDIGYHVVDYKTIIFNIQKKYILGINEKYLPLEINEKDGEPQIGLLPKEVNELFQQDISKIIRLDKNPIKIIEGASGFLRIGVENRSRYKADSFLSAVAPFFNCSNSQQMKNLLWRTIEEKVFININYGNLMLEFYNVGYRLPEEYKNSDNLTEFADNKLNLDYNETFNGPETERIIKSYLNFKEFLMSDNQTKEYRQFALLFSQSSNLLRRNGITFIVIDILEYNTLNIRCPPYGYNTELMDKNDIGFLLHHYSGTWEPIFYISNNTLLTSSPFIFQKSSFSIWPPVVKSLFGEFKKACEVPGTVIYTAQSHIQANNLLPLSHILNEESKIKDKYSEFSFHGIMRDSYNHISGLVCKIEKGEKVRYFFLPVIDDGIIVTNKNLYVNYNEFKDKIGTASETYEFYNKFIIKYAKGYKPKQTIINKDNINNGMELENGLFIPINNQSKPIENIPNVSTTKLFQWDINRDIIFGSPEISRIEEKTIHLTEDNIEEIYEHLRITFASYLEKSQIKNKLEEDIIFKNISLNEKRRRFIVLFGKEVLSWFSNETNKSKEVSFIRKDCIIQSESSCNDKCVFTSDKKCKIHLPMEENLGYILMLRLFDEIIRSTQKRSEIFKNEISKLVFINKAIHVGEKKDQYIIPENTLEWSDLLRFDWLKNKLEAPKYFEEMYRYQPIGDITKIKELSNEIKAILNPEDPNTKNLKYYEVTNEKNLLPILEILHISPEKIKYNGESGFFNLMEIGTIASILSKTNKLFIQINAINIDNITISPILGKNFEIKNIYVMLTTQEGSGFIINNNKLNTIPYTELPEIIRRRR